MAFMVACADAPEPEGMLAISMFSGYNLAGGF